MANRSRSYLKIIIENFIDSLSPKRLKQKPVLIGKDKYGNKYYELCSDTSTGKKVIRRWYETEIPDDWEKEVPVEWEAWLRRRRPDPPGQQEIDENYKKMLLVQSKAADLKETQTSAIKNKEEITSEFPRHEEYELYPGEKAFSRNENKK